jgi:N-terminal domain of anti-restriction factor ArdC
MAVKHRKQLTDEERAERRECDREYARQAVERLRSSKGWRAWLTTRATFHGYSLGNQLLIAMQRPSASRVAGFKAWLKLGYCVSRGETAIRIWAPCPPSRKQLERWRQNGSDPHQRPRTFFKLTAVFDRLSRVRSGGCRRRPSRESRCLPVSRLCCSSAPASRRRGRLWPARSSRSRRPRSTAQRRSRARLAGTPGNRSALTSCRECRHRVPIPAISRTDGKSPKAAALHQEHQSR